MSGHVPFHPQPDQHVWGGASKQEQPQQSYLQLPPNLPARQPAAHAHMQRDRLSAPAPPAADHSRAQGATDGGWTSRKRSSAAQQQATGVPQHAPGHQGSRKQAQGHSARMGQQAPPVTAPPPMHLARKRASSCVLARLSGCQQEAPPSRAGAACAPNNNNAAGCHPSLPATSPRPFPPGAPPRAPHKQPNTAFPQRSRQPSPNPAPAALAAATSNKRQRLSAANLFAAPEAVPASRGMLGPSRQGGTALLRPSACMPATAGAAQDRAAPAAPATAAVAMTPDIGSNTDTSDEDEEIARQVAEKMGRHRLRRLRKLL